MPPRPLSIGVALTVLAFAWPGMAQSAPGKRPSVVAVFTETPPVLDGRLDDAVWATATPSGGFVERSPTLRGKPPVDTTFVVIFDTEAIYFGVDCRDDQPDKIRALSRQRDGNAIFRDDAVSIKLDPTLDKRTTLGFGMNPGGARIDYRGIDESDFRIEYDMQWEGKAARVEGGWQAEFRIPYAALEIDPRSPPSRMGLNLSRDHSRRTATYDWALMPPPYSPISASIYGSIGGLEVLPEIIAERGGETGSAVRSFAVIPYARSGFRRVPSDDSADLHDESLFSGGVDVKAEIGSLRGHVTVNTDFAQVDLDNQVVNLTRFGLFLPEKRDFFLQDLEVFSFGRQREAQMFYSRRIGLDIDGSQIPILAGAKVVGRPADNVRFGVLQMTTQPEGDRPWTSNAVGRTLVELGGGSNAGFMLAHRQSIDDSDDRNLMMGVDSAWRGEEVPLLVQGFAMGSVTGTAAGDGSVATGGAGQDTTDRLAPGVGASAALRDSLYQPRLGYAFYHPELRGDLGFFERVGVHRADATFEVEPRIDSGGLSKLELIGSSQVIANANADEVLDWRVTGETELFWNAGYNVGVVVTHRVESVLDPFTVGRETTVAPEQYRMWVASIFGNTPSTYPISAAVFLTGRDYYGGQLLEADGSLSWAPAPLLRFDIGSRYDHVTFGQLQDFDSFLLNGRINFGFTNALGLRLFTGYNLLGDVLQVQSRFRWTYAPSSDLFLVQQVNLDDDAWTPVLASVIAKASYRWSP
jgi:Domain of unknown function (DUF5916)/Carbohydrate family 9 binding domain-like